MKLERSPPLFRYDGEAWLNAALLNNAFVERKLRRLVNKLMYSNKFEKPFRKDQSGDAPLVRASMGLNGYYASE